MRYDVWTTYYGIPPGKAWAEWKHVKVNRRPLSLRRAGELAAAAETLARVYDRSNPTECVLCNERAPRAFEGWLEDSSWEAQLPLSFVRRLKR